MKIPLKLIYKYMAIFLHFSPTLNHLHPLQVENCDSNLRLVVDEMTMVNSGLLTQILAFNDKKGLFLNRHITN